MMTNIKDDFTLARELFGEDCGAAAQAHKLWSEAREKLIAEGLMDVADIEAYTDPIIGRCDYESKMEPLLRLWSQRGGRHLDTKSPTHNVYFQWVDRSILLVSPRLRRRIAKAVWREATAKSPSEFRVWYIPSAMKMARALGIEVVQDTRCVGTKLEAVDGRPQIVLPDDGRPVSHEKREAVFWGIAVTLLQQSRLAFTNGDADLLAAEIAIGRDFSEENVLACHSPRFVGAWRRHLRHLRLGRHVYTLTPSAPKNAELAAAMAEPEVEEVSGVRASIESKVAS